MLINCHPTDLPASFSQPCPDPEEHLTLLSCGTCSSSPASQPDLHRSGTSSTSSSRKGIPRRSLSTCDDRPGIVFKMNHKRRSIERCSGTGHLPYTASTTAFSLTVPTAGSQTTLWIGTRSTRSRSISVRPNADGSGLLDAPPSLVPFRRQRSNSLSLDEDTMVDVDSDLDIPMQPIGIGSRARKASIAHHGAGGETGYGGSMSHLVPNALLSSLSRRISTSSTHPGCTCASCESTITPYWRDGWSPSVMLCNACGLRYQKFARRCPTCVYIPRKEDSLGENCIRCGTKWVI